MRTSIWGVGLSLGLITGCGPSRPGGAQETSTTDDSQAGSTIESSSSTTSESGETGTETETETETGTETGAPACDTDELQLCINAVEATGLDCQEPCDDQLSCAGRSCIAGCFASYFASKLDCSAAHCPEQLDPNEQVVADCHATAHSCTSTPDCDLHGCSYALYDCLWTVNFLLDLDLAFEWTDSCVITLPGPPVFPELSGWWSGNLGDHIEPVGTDCSDPTLAHWLSDAHDAFELCPNACAEFANTGSLVFVYGVPAP